MKISAKTEYACVAMLELALQYKSGEPVRIRKIGERHHVPPRFLVQILLQLKGAGLVASVRGAAGGYQLLKPPEEISLGQIMDVIDGLVGRGVPGEHGFARFVGRQGPRSGVAQDVAATQHNMLNGITLATLVERMKESDEGMYHT